MNSRPRGTRRARYVPSRARLSSRGGSTACRPGGRGPRADTYGATQPVVTPLTSLGFLSKVPVAFFFPVARSIAWILFFPGSVT